MYKVGEYYNIKCAVIGEISFIEVMRRECIQIDEHSANMWLYRKYKVVVPIIDLPHSDKENGQPEVHYHIDDRFVQRFDKFSSYYFKIAFRIDVKDILELITLNLKCNSEKVNTTTTVNFISKSKLKHKCIHKGKCPHRGYNLENEIEIDGVITCPLHGLKFNNETKELITV